MSHTPSRVCLILLAFLTILVVAAVRQEQWFPTEVPDTAEEVGEAVAPRLNLLTTETYGTDSLFLSREPISWNQRCNLNRMSPKFAQASEGVVRVQLLDDYGLALHAGEVPNEACRLYGQVCLTGDPVLIRQILGELPGQSVLDD